MKRTFTKTGTWRDPRAWVSATERFNDALERFNRWGTSTRDRRDAKWFMAGVAVIGLVLYLSLR